MDKPKHPAEVAVGEAFAVVPGVGKIAQALWENANDWRRYRGEQTAAQVAEIVGAEQLYRRAEENPELAALLVQVLEMAERTGFEAKRRLLVMAAANAFKNDEEIDPALLVVRALSQLEPVHIRALVRLVAYADAVGPAPDFDFNDEVGDYIAKMDAAGSAIPQPVLIALINTGAVTPSYMHFGGGTHLHDVSHFGRQLLEKLRQADPEDEVFNWTPPN